MTIINNEDIIRMARKAGFETKVLNSIDGEEVVCFDPLITDMLKDFAAIVAAHEREACAKVCAMMEWRGRSDEAIWKGDAADECAAAIRARGDK